MMQTVDHRIPTLALPCNAGSYHDIPFDATDSRANEPLVRLDGYGIVGESFYARTDGGNAPYNRKIDGAAERIWCRKTVAEKLARVNDRLKAFGVELFVFDAYRPIKCQKGLWDFFWKKVAHDNPQASEEERRSICLTIVSDPTRFQRTDSKTWPLHSSGGAVDLTLRKRGTRELLDMGAGFDELSANSTSDAFERKLAAGEIAENDPRLQNRRLLHWAMTQEGFTNYHLEWWHFDYGNQGHVLYAKLLGLPNAPQAAWYGYVDPPSDV